MVKFASPSCVCFISLGFLLATIICVWVRMVCSLHSVTTGSRDRANVPLIIYIYIYTAHYSNNTGSIAGSPRVLSSYKNGRQEIDLESIETTARARR